MTPFVRSVEGYTADLEPAERAVLADLATRVALMIQAHVGLAPVPGWTPTGWVSAVESTGECTDTAILRLFPVASTDEAVAQEFRHLASGDIAVRKISGLRTLATLAAAGPRLVVSRTQADAMAGAFTDIRLVMADRLHLATDADVAVLHEELSSPASADAHADSGVRRQLIAVFLLAGILQESLLEGMLADFRSSRPE